MFDVARKLLQIKTMMATVYSGFYDNNKEKSQNSA